MSTIKDVAKKAGVSIATVSHIINGTRYVSEELTLRVRAVIKEMEYEPHVVARRLRGQKTHMIGLILPDSANPFFAEVARGVEDTCFDAGYSVILCNSDNNLRKEIDYLRLLANKGVDGIAFVSIGQDHEAIEVLGRQDQPHVLIDRQISDFDIDAILVDNRDGARRAVELLIELGHRRIGFISGPKYLSSSVERKRGYIEALTEAKLEVDGDLIAEGDFGLPGGEGVAKLLLNRRNSPTALFVANDVMAIGALSVARKLGMSVPTDISVIGFDDIALAARMVPALTTVAQPKYQIGQTTANILLHRIKCPNDPVATKRLSTHLVLRESHGPCTEGRKL